jgi:peptidoglycan lytic transglycosylase G
MGLFGRREQQSGSRSTADREAARLERERRRAQREGRPVGDAVADDDDFAPPPDPGDPPAREEAPVEPVEEAPAPTPTPAPPAPAAAEPKPEPAEPEPEPEPEPDPEPAPRPGAEERPEPTAAMPDPVDGEIHAARTTATARADADGDGDGGEPDSTQPLEPVATAPARRTVSLPRPQTDDLGHHSEWDRPIGNRRVSRAEYQAQPGAPGMPPYRSIGVPKRRRGLRRLLPLLALLIVIGVAVFGYFLYQPFHGKGFGAVTVTVPPGSGASQIGDLLASKGVVQSSFFFSLRARLAGDRGKLRAGTYHLKQSMPYGEALAALTTAPKAAATIDVTLPEGPSRRELAPIVRRAGVHGSYRRASARSPKLNPRNYGAPRGTRSLEGFLFPDTYQLRRSQATARRLVNDQLAAFKRRFGSVNLKQAKRRHLTRYDVLTIASMIEREAVVPRDRALISAVIYNRLRQGIPLGIDATLRYRLNNWTRPLRVSELNRRTPYNTRLRKGLPPTPIGNPGLASIRAAAHPANVNYIFYVVKPCGNGAHAFSSTNAQFQKDVAAYKKARAKRGGKDPSHC